MNTHFIETKRLYLRPPQQSDLNNWLQLQTDADVMRYIGRGQPRSKKEIELSLNSAIRHWQKYGYSLCPAFEKSTDNFIGYAGLIHLAYEDSAIDIEIGYCLLKAFWSRGYATELARAITDWGFTHLDISKLVGITKPENKASQNVLLKIGMQYKKIYYYNDIKTFYYEILTNKEP